MYVPKYVFLCSYVPKYVSWHVQDHFQATLQLEHSHINSKTKHEMYGEVIFVKGRL